ncbi:hypothetical protein HHI36_006952 [Cryptolaemus montrouzieri]|uniref:Uncharacterized protein n=1 Tax=Cryptolaemus montrouzieri TaxID=559131 RepID=A0ABD2MN42_9CUCU
MDLLNKLLQPLKPKRPMKFPYTFTAKIAQFPLMFHLKRQWLWRYYLYGVIASIPVFWKIHKMANSPSNIQKWKEMAEEERYHAAHKWD